MIALLEALMATQNQRPPPPHPQETIISEIATTHVVSDVPIRPRRQNEMPAVYPWGMPPNYMPENFNPTTEAPLVNQVPLVQPVMVITPPVVHVVTQVQDLIYHTAPSKNSYVYERTEEFYDQF